MAVPESHCPESRNRRTTSASRPTTEKGLIRAVNCLTAWLAASDEDGRCADLSSESIADNSGGIRT